MTSIPNTLLLAAAAGHDPKDHVLPHGLFQISSTNLRLPIFENQAGQFWFTNHLLMTLVAAGLTLLVFGVVGARYRMALARGDSATFVPRGFVGLIESLMDALRSGVVKPVLGPDTDRFMPFLWTVFFFILFCNLLGMVPLDSIVALLTGVKHLGGTATGNINITAGLAICAFFTIHFMGTFEVYRGLVAGTYGHHHGEGDASHGSDEHGAHGDAHREHVHGHHGVSPMLAVLAAPVLYLWNFAPHVFQKPGPRGPLPAAMRIVTVPLYTVLLAVTLRLILGVMFKEQGAVVGQWFGAVLGVVAGFSTKGLHWLDLLDALMWEILFLLETIGAFVKPFALAMRLFANMIAGHIVLASLILLIPVFKGLTLGYLGSSLPVAIGCTLLSGLELFVAFLQSYIFMFLTTMFIGAAIHPEH
ncbi:MAG: F0F1 ATP synthase subunit A [Phycisphaerae bacterium]|nr:F0F1 ATP synthase subunit A [Phycisphaerae bacterium]